MKILILVLSTSQDQYSPILDAVKKSWYSHNVDNIRKIFYYGNSKENILVGDNFYCFKNNLTSLEGCPKSVGGGFNCHTNPIGSIFDKVDIDFIKAFKSFKVLNNGVINLKRLRYLMSMFDKYIDIEEIEKHYTIK